MIELKNELFAASANGWHCVPFTENHHKWLLEWHRFGDKGNFTFCFESPKKRRYTYYANANAITYADVHIANGTTIASYWESRGDKPVKLDAVLRITPKHILDRLFMLLDAIG